MGWKVLEPFSSGLQPDALPSKLPARRHGVFLASVREKARCPVSDTGLCNLAIAIADVTCARASPVHNPSLEDSESAGSDSGTHPDS